MAPSTARIVAKFAQVSAGVRVDLDVYMNFVIVTI